MGKTTMGDRERDEVAENPVDNIEEPYWNCPDTDNKSTKSKGDNTEGHIISNDDTNHGRHTVVLGESVYAMDTMVIDTESSKGIWEVVDTGNKLPHEEYNRSKANDKDVNRDIWTAKVFRNNEVTIKALPRDNTHKNIQDN